MSLITPASDFYKERPEVQVGRIPSSDQLTQFELNTLKQQYRKLKYYSDTADSELAQKEEEKVFINLSLVELFRNLSVVIISIINELLAINDKTTFADLVYIFVREDRLVYLGLLIMMIAFAIYIVRITE
jgi:hypothetical protein